MNGNYLLDTSKLVKTVLSLSHKKREINVTKWGIQELDILFKALIEEIGELSRALLNNPEKHHSVKEECIHSIALLLEIYIQDGF